MEEVDQNNEQVDNSSVSSSLEPKMGSDDLSKRRKWTETERATISKYYPSEGGVGVARRLNRTAKAISRQAAILGVRFDKKEAKKTDYYHRRARNNKNWTASEIAILEEFYPTEGPQGVTQRLGETRTYDAIISKAGILRLRRPAPKQIILKAAEIEQLLCGQFPGKLALHLLEVLREAAQSLTGRQWAIAWLALPKPRGGIWNQIRSKCQRCSAWESCKYWERHKGYYTVRFPQQDLAFVKWGTKKSQDGLVVRLEYVAAAQADIEINQFLRRIGFKSSRVAHFLLVGAMMLWMTLKRAPQYDHFEPLDIRGYQEDLAYEGQREGDQGVERVLYLIEVKSGITATKARRGYAQLEQYAAQHDCNTYTQIIQILVVPVWPRSMTPVPPNVLILTWRDMGWCVESLATQLSYFINFKENEA